MNKKITILVILFLLLFVSQNYLQNNVFFIVKYLDELYAMLAIPFIAFSYKKVVLRKSDFVILILIVVLNIIGLLSSFINQLQPISAVLKDMVSINKFFASIYVSKCIFNKIYKKIDYSKVILVCKITTCLLFGLLVFDRIFTIFNFEFRYGMKASQLFYSHPTYLCAAAIFLLLIFVWVDGMFDNKSNKRKNLIYLIMLSLMIVSTLRVKAIIFISIFWIIYFTIMRKNKPLKLALIVGFCCLAFLVGKNQFQKYFIDNDSARSMLFNTSFEIANDYFPLGAGFATFGSDASKDSYSKLYYEYGLSQKYGLSPAYPHYISDNFWPMIIGQFGYIGLVVYVLIIIKICGKIQKLYIPNCNNTSYYIALSALIYPLIMSTSVSAFVAPTSIPLAIILGLCFAENVDSKRKNKNEVIV